MQILHIEAPNRGAQGDHVYRTRQPCRALGEIPGVRVASGDLLSADVNDRLLSADVLVLCDVVDADLLPVLHRRRQAGRPTVYEINDHFRAPQSWNPTAYLAENLLTRSLSAQLAAHADAIQVTVPELSRSFADLHQRQVVLPNQLWERPPLRPRAETDTVWLGWGGSLGHREDLIWVLPVLQRTLTRHPHVRLAVMGPESLWPLFEALPQERLRFVTGGPLDRYYDFLQSLDVGICPLLPTDFNRCRSDVKFLELAAHGVVAVCSDLAPYHDSVKHDDNGLRFGTLDQLGQALDHVLVDRRFRERLAARAHASIADRLERNHVQRRLALFRALLGDTPPAPAWPEPTRLPYPDSRYEILDGAQAGRHLHDGLILARDRQPTEAVRRFRDATVQAPDFYRTWLQLGTTLPDPKEGVQALERARQLAPDSPSVILALATRLEEIGAGAEAQQLLQELMDEEPELGCGAAEARIGAQAEKAGDLARATTAYQAALVVNPFYAEPAVRLALLALAAGNPHQALAVIDQAQRHDPELWLLDFLHGRALLEAGQPGPARTALERALGRAHDRRPVLAQLARVHLALGDKTAARAALLQAQTAAP